MQRIINDPDQVVPDYLKGFPKAHPDFVATTNHPRVICRRDEVGMGLREPFQIIGYDLVGVVYYSLHDRRPPHSQAFTVPYIRRLSSRSLP